MEEGVTPCPEEGCGVPTQGGADGMVAHLVRVHYPDLGRDTVREHYEAWLRGQFGEAGEPDARIDRFAPYTG